MIYDLLSNSNVLINIAKCSKHLLCARSILRGVHARSPLILTITWQGMIVIIISILQMRTWRHRGLSSLPKAKHFTKAKPDNNCSYYLLGNLLCARHALYIYYSNKSVQQFCRLFIFILGLKYNAKNLNKVSMLSRQEEVGWIRIRNHDFFKRTIFDISYSRFISL